MINFEKCLINNFSVAFFCYRKMLLLVFILVFSGLSSSCHHIKSDGVNDGAQPKACFGACGGYGEGSFSFEGECTDAAIAVNHEEFAKAQARGQQEAKNAATIDCWKRGGGACLCSGGQMVETDVIAEEYGHVETLELGEKSAGVTCLVRISYEYKGGSCSDWSSSIDSLLAPNPSCGGHVTRSSIYRGGQYGICPTPCNEVIMEEVRQGARESARRQVNRECASVIGYSCQAVGGREIDIGERCSNDPDIPEGGRPECDYEAHRGIIRAQCVFAP